MSSPAEIYESYVAPSMFAPLVPLLLEWAPPREGDRVLDVGCGTGLVARRVAPLVGPQGIVFGLDITPEMLAQAQSAAEREGSQIEWHESPAEELPFPDGRFDLVLCQQALQFSPNRAAAVSEMYRVLDDGGRVGLNMWLGLEHQPFYEALECALVRRLGAPALAAGFSLGNAGEINELLLNAGFDGVEIMRKPITARYHDPERAIASIVGGVAAYFQSFRDLDEQARQDLFHSIHDEMSPLIEQYTQDEYLVFPMHAHFARGHKRSS